MNYIIIGDLHGKEFWKTAVEDQGIEGNMFVFVGDYFDSFTVPSKSQRVNFGQVCAFKKKYPNNVVLLHGNHDFINYEYKEMCSGYQGRYAYIIQQLLIDNKDLFDTIYQFDDYLVSHAGVSQVWMDNSGVEAIEQINDLWLKSPECFMFYPSDREGYGDNVNQGPLWIRPSSLREAGVEGYCQIVGHTATRKITHQQGFSFIDTDGRYYLKIDENGPQAIAVSD